MLKMYDALAEWFPLLTPPAEYAEEAGIYRQHLLSAGDKPAVTLVEFGSGGGHNASHLKQHFQMTLVEPSEGMRAISRRLNPECEHLPGDMRNVRLGREFDRVFIHDAICYMTSLADLRAAMETAYVHCRSGGVALIAPDFIREKFHPGAEHGGSDQGARGFRYLAWCWDPDPTDHTYLVDYAFLIRSEDGTVRAEHDRHVEGLFSRAEWLTVLGEAGFQPTAVVFEHSDVEGEPEMFVCTKPKR